MHISHSTLIDGSIVHHEGVLRRTGYAPCTQPSDPHRTISDIYRISIGLPYRTPIGLTCRLSGWSDTYRTISDIYRSTVSDPCRTISDIYRTTV
jgi:hypothetical protein